MKAKHATDEASVQESCTHFLNFCMIWLFKKNNWVVMPSFDVLNLDFA